MIDGTLLAGLFIGLGASLLGNLIILKRMALVSDALSHVALPGVALALVAGFSPFWGALAFLIIASLLVFFIQEKFRRFATETLVGVLFTAALAIGVLVAPSEELFESLFGDISHLNNFDIGLAIIGGLALFVVTLLFYRMFIKVMVAPDLARIEGVNVRQVEFLFLMLLAFGVALGIKTIGTLLMGALVILPAATAKNLSATLTQMVIISVIISIASITVGLWLSGLWQLPPGPAVVLLNALLFTVSLLR